MTVDGEFLHYIFPLQFLDSPEWDSLRPTEEGIFQVKVKGFNVFGVFLGGLFWFGFFLSIYIFSATGNCSSTV